jgi:uncharacterized membrane protein YkgB
MGELTTKPARPFAWGMSRSLLLSTNPTYEEVLVMDIVIAFAQRIAGPFLRFSLAIILAWIGALKFVDPSPVVGLLQASLPFLAFSTFVYLLGAVEIVVAILLATGIGLLYAGLVTVGLFAGTLTIFVIAPGVTGFPFLTLAGQFLLKDLGLMAAAVNVIAMQPAPQRTRPMPGSVPVEA